jgi:CRISPR-associated protein Csb1
MSTPRRHVFRVALEPLLGSTFQPTGFPDLGAATFSRPRPDGDDLPCLLVESAQSMANRLEGTAWDTGTNSQAESFTGLPYVEVVDADGAFLTSSRLEAHRLFSAFVRDADLGGTKGDLMLLERLDMKPDHPLNYPAMAAAILALDPLSLLHGVFFAGKSSADRGRGAWPAQPRFTRSVSAVIEAQDVRPVASGGRKSDSVRHRLDEETHGGTAEGYGSIPFHRTEFTAATILASFVVDTQLIRSYGLPQPATELLETLALWEIRTLLDGGLRLRTACDLAVIDNTINDTRGNPLPSAEEIDARLRTAIERSALSLGDGKPVTVTWTPRKSAK